MRVGDPSRGERSARDGKRSIAAELGEPGAQLRQKTVPAAEMVQARRDLEDERLRRLERDLRRELAGPGGD